MMKFSSDSGSGSVMNRSQLSSSGSLPRGGRPNTTPITSIRIVPKAVAGGTTRSTTGPLHGSSSLVVLNSPSSSKKLAGSARDADADYMDDDFVSEEVEDCVQLSGDDSDTQHPASRRAPKATAQVSEEKTAVQSPNKNKCIREGSTAESPIAQPSVCNDATVRHAEATRDVSPPPVQRKTSGGPIRKKTREATPAAQSKPGERRIEKKKSAGKIDVEPRRPITADPALDISPSAQQKSLVVTAAKRAPAAAASKQQSSHPTLPAPPAIAVSPLSPAVPTSTAQAAPRKLRVNVSHRALIGKGSFGVVYQAMDRDTNHIVACKEICLVKSSSGAPDPVPLIKQELALLKQLDHPNIVKYLGEECDSSYLRMYMEFVTGGSISSILRMFGALQEKQASIFTRQMLLGLQYLHERNICHRDLKGDNLLVDTQGTLKLADFGAAKELATQTTTIAGTAYFMAPEVIQGVGHGVAADVWSAGCCVIEMLTGKPPFFHLKNQYAIMMHIAEEKRPLHDIFPPNASHSCLRFLQRCLVRNPNMRATVKELLQEDWIVHPPDPTDGEETRLLDTGSIHLAGQRSILEARESICEAVSDEGADVAPNCSGTDAMHDERDSRLPQHRYGGEVAPLMSNKQMGPSTTHSFNPLDMCDDDA